MRNESKGLMKEVQKTVSSRLLLSCTYKYHGHHWCCKHVQQASTSVLTYCIWRIRCTWFYSTVAKQYGTPYDGAHKHPQYEIQHFSKNRFRSSSYCNNIVTTQRYDHLTHNGLESFQNGRQLTEKWCCNGYNGVNGGFSARLLR